MSVRKEGDGRALWMSFDERQRSRDEKRDAVLRTAARLFLEEGYHRAALSEVAARLKITKPALYNYFRSKEEILLACFRAGQELYEAGMTKIERSQGDGLHKLQELIRSYVLVMTTDFGMCVARLDDRELGAGARAEVRRGKRRYEVGLRALVADGIKDGSIGPCDPKMVACVITGAVNGVGSWYRPDGPLSTDAIAGEFASRLTEGLLPSPRGTPPSKAVTAKPARAAKPQRS